MSDSGSDEDDTAGPRHCCTGCGFTEVVHIASIVTTLCMAILVGVASDSTVSSVLKWAGIFFLVGNAVVIGVSMLSCATVVPVEAGGLVIAMAVCTLGGAICLWKWDNDSASVLLCTGISLFDICGTSAETYVADSVKILVGITIILQCLDVALVVYAASCGKVGRAFGVARKARKLSKRSKHSKRSKRAQDDEEDDDYELGGSRSARMVLRGKRMGMRSEDGPGEEVDAGAVGTVAMADASESEEEPLVGKRWGRRKSLVV